MKQSSLDKLLASNYIPSKPDLTPSPTTPSTPSSIAWGIVGMIIIGLLVIYFSGGFPQGNVGP